MPRASLQGADLRHAMLFEADLGAVNNPDGTQTRTNLQDTLLVGVNLNFSNLKAADLTGARGGVAPGGQAAKATLRGAFMPGVILTDADLRSADLSMTHLYGGAQLRVKLDSVDLSGANCAEAVFTQSLTDAQFDGATLVSARFTENAVLDNAFFNGAFLQGADFSQALSVTGVSLTGAIVTATSGATTYQVQDGSSYTVVFDATNLGGLLDDPSVICPDGLSGGAGCCPSGDLETCCPTVDEDQVCSTGRLAPRTDQAPFPPIPPCVATAGLCFENCQPDIDCCTACIACSFGDCSLCSALCS